LALDDFPQPGHHRRRRFLLHQLRVIDLAAGIIQNHDQVIPALIPEPAVMTAVDVQQQARQGPSFAPLAMHPTLAAFGHQTGALQGPLDPGVAPADAVLLPQLLVKMLHVQIEILFPVEPQHSLHLGQRDALGRRPAPPPVEQPVIAKLFVALMPAPHLPIADADDLGCLPPRDLLRQGPQNHFLYLHRPLHCGLRVRIHAWHGLLLSPPEKRTDHVLSQPDISCATDMDKTPAWRNRVFPGIIRVLPRTSGIIWSKSWHKFAKFAAKGRSPVTTSLTPTTSPSAAGASTSAP